MTISRRELLAGMTAAAAATRADALQLPQIPTASDGFEPWLEVDRAALAHNAGVLSRAAGGRQLIAVVKNNAYGLGLATAGPLLDAIPQVWGFAVVRPAEALALLAARVQKPVLLMGPTTVEEALELARRNVRLAPYLEGDRERLVSLARRLERKVRVHLYVDTGMHRMGLPFERLMRWLEPRDLRSAIDIEGSFTELTEDAGFDLEQAARLRGLAEQARVAGAALGRLHAASSDALMRPAPETFLDLVRPGLSLYGGYPTAESKVRGALRPAYRMKARVIRLDHLATGEGVSYHHRYRADAPTWLATLAIGHVDGYPSGAVRGCEVLLRGKLHRVVGTVSASHTMVELGSETAVQVGDAATLVGPDDPALHPNTVAERSGWPEYNMFMHLGADLRRRVV
ncbi:MAG: alanine racemase [Gemmatimonadales bacterium]